MSNSLRRPLDRLAQNFLGYAVRINVRSIEKIDSRFQTNVHDASRFLYVAVAPSLKKLSLGPQT